MKAGELRELADRELERTVADLREELFNLRFQETVGQVENTQRVRQVRRDIARALTIQRERELVREEEA